MALAAGPTDPPPAGGGGTTRNAVPIYDVGPRRVTGHRLAETPAAHLGDARARRLPQRVRDRVVHGRAGPGGRARPAGVPARAPLRPARRARRRRRRPGRRLGRRRCPTDVGRGLGFARYKDKGAYCAVVAEVEAEIEVRVRRLTVVADVGLVVNPDGVRNQIEGGATQSASWTTEGAGALRPAPDHQRRLGALPDPALRRGAARSRSTSSTATEPSVGCRRGRPGPDRGRHRQRGAPRPRRTGPGPPARRRRRSSEPSRPPPWLRRAAARLETTKPERKTQ